MTRQLPTGQLFCTTQPYPTPVQQADQRGPVQGHFPANQSIGVNAKLTETDLRLGITAQYLTAYADFQQIRFFQSTLKLLKEEQEILKSLVDQGIYLQTDRINLALSITNQEIVIKQGMMQYKNDLGC